MTAVRAPLAGSKCKPNFHVVVTHDPDELMRLWRKRAPRLFGMASRTAVRHVMGKARPVRVWYNVWEMCGEGVLGAPVNADPALQGMSTWDRAFLEGLYTTSQNSRFQRTMIADQMVRGFVAH